jgi:hypothetical protein
MTAKDKLVEQSCTLAELRRLAAQTVEDGRPPVPLR